MKKQALLLSMCAALCAPSFAQSQAGSLPDARQVSYELKAVDAQGRVVRNASLVTSAAAPAVIEETSRHAYASKVEALPDGSALITPGEVTTGMGASVELKSIGADGSSAEAVVNAWVKDPVSITGSVVAEPMRSNMTMTLPVSLRVGQPVALGSRDGVTFYLTLRSISAI